MAADSMTSQKTIHLWDAVSLGIESKKNTTACNSMLAQLINMKLIRSYIRKVNDFLSNRGRLLGIEEWME